MLKKKMEEHREQYEKLSGQAEVLLTRLTNIKKIPGVEEESEIRLVYTVLKSGNG